MGMHFKDIKYFEEIFEYLKHEKYFNGKDLRLCEIGDLWLRRNLHKYTKLRCADAYFKAKGFTVDIIDLNIGKENSWNKEREPFLLKYDLGRPLEFDFEPYDFLMDFGTAEHITNQYEFRKNIHNLCKKNGVMMHSNPSDRYNGGEQGKYHGLYHYTAEFYGQLAYYCDYEIIDIREMQQKYKINCHSASIGRKNFLYVTMVKRKNREFMSLFDFNEIMSDLANT